MFCKKGCRSNIHAVIIFALKLVVFVPTLHTLKRFQKGTVLSVCIVLDYISVDPGRYTHPQKCLTLSKRQIRQDHLPCSLTFAPLEVKSESP